MASLMDDLIGVLESETAEYKKLIELSETMKQALIQSDVVMVENITTQEQDVTTGIQNMEHKRVQIMQNMAVVLNLKPEELKVSMLESSLEKQPQQQKKLVAVRTELKHTMEELRRANQQNQVLIHQAMELVEFDLNLFRSMRQAPETANYNKSAYNTGELLGGGGFDAKQ